jgi:hypothetical protein
LNKLRIEGATKEDEKNAEDENSDSEQDGYNNEEIDIRNGT